MTSTTTVVLLLIFIVSTPVFCRVAEKAVQLLQYNETVQTFLLNETALNLISNLKQPIQVISAVGDARIGKSTSLNFVLSHWEGDGEGQKLEEIFPTNDSFERCTQGVWVSAIELERGSVLFMDVEGTDLGDDGVTDHLSIFTALMSSGMVVFARSTVTNHVVDFLYRVSRLSELIFDELHVENFPRLRVALITQLDPPSREKLKDFVMKALINPGHKDDLNKNRKIIANHFPREHIDASLIPHVSDRNFFKDYKMLEKIGYAEGMRYFTKQLKQLPWKRTLGGGLMGGLNLKLLATKLAVAMNKNSWLDFGNVYLNVEKHVCSSSHEKFVKPLEGETADRIEQLMEGKLKSFEEGCALGEIRNQTRIELEKIIDNKRHFEKLQTSLLEEEKKLQKAQQDLVELKEKHKRDMEGKHQEIIKEKQNSRELNDKLELMRNEHRQVMTQIAELNSRVESLRRALEEARDNNGGLGGFFTGLVAGALAAFGWPSDVRLKQNITALASSRYHCLGLRGVQWVWKKAASEFGLMGAGRGLIAQEVETLYPDAVVTGSDGYKRVNYGLLMIYREQFCHV